MNTQFDKSAPVINPEVALRRLGGDESLLATLATFFLQDAPAIMDRLRIAHRSGDLSIVSQIAHSLKGLSATFEAIPFLRILDEVETQARAGESPALSEMVAELDHEFTRLVTVLQSLVE